ncbi:MAG: L-rhamnose mutarotase [Chloroflexota bacterium]
MQQFALTINLKDDPDLIAQYKDYHRNVWPEVLDCLRIIGITKMDIFLLGRRMFMLMEANDDFVPERDFPKLDDMHPRYKEWQALMDKFQERVPEAKPDEHWAEMEKVFDLNDEAFWG